LGVRIALDDFGTGYSSLSSLRDFPVDILKIDKSFIDHLGAAANDERIFTSAIIELGAALEMEVVAEGIEDAVQVSRLQELGCDKGQGYYFARPLDAAEVKRFLGAQLPASWELDAEATLLAVSG
jgi:EAL domain-containing protein (putative c-di-GMP-specific phosphodiesterase class I)